MRWARTRRIIINVNVGDDVKIMTPDGEQTTRVTNVTDIAFRVELNRRIFSRETGKCLSLDDAKAWQVVQDTQEAVS